MVNQPSEDQWVNPEKKHVSLDMNMVAAYKGVKMSRPGEEEIEFELNSKKKVYIPLNKVLQYVYWGIGENIS